MNKKLLQQISRGALTAVVVLLSSITSIEAAGASPSLTAQYTLPGHHANSFFSNGTSVWVTDPTQGIIKVDATSGSYTNPIATSGHAQSCQIGNNLWVVDYYGAHVVEYNASTNAVEQTLTVYPNSSGIACDANTIWVDSYSGVEGINATSGVKTFGPVANADFPFSDGTYIWLLNQPANQVLQYSIQSGSLVHTISIGSPLHVVSDGTNVWVASTTGVSEIDPNSGTILATVPTQYTAQAISCDGSSVWIDQGNGQNENLVQIDVNSATVVSTTSITIPGNTMAEVMGIAADGLNAWVLLSEQIYRNPQSTTVLAKIAAPATRSISFQTGSHVTLTSAVQGTQYTIPSTVPTRANATFLGWSDGTNLYQPGASYLVGTSNVTFSAQWQDIISYAKPSSPTSVSATINGDSAIVSFIPGSAGNLPTSLEVDLLSNGVNYGDVCTISLANQCVVGNLAPNTPYAFSVTATNALGSATSSVSNVVDNVVALPTTTTTTTVPSVSAKVTITCVKGKVTKSVTGSNPVCPLGYKKK